MTEWQGSRVSARDPEGPAADPAGARRGPRKASPRSLENAALAYLQRFPASRTRLHRVLTRRVERSARAHPSLDRAEAARWIEDILTRLEHAGWLDDARHAETRAGWLHRRGESQRAIAARLHADGVGRDDVRAALDTLRTDSDAPDPDLAAAAALARRRRLGPYRLAADDRAAHRRRDLAALARKGFGPGVARTVIDAADVDTLESRLQDG